MWFGQLRALGQLWGCCGLLGMAELGKDPGTQPRAMLEPHCVPGAGDQQQPEGPVSLQSCSSPGRLRGAPQLQVGTWDAKEGAQLPGHTSAKAAQSPPANCMGPAQLVLGSPGWGELVLPPQSWISCMRRVSQRRPSPHLKPSLPPSTGWGTVPVLMGVPSPAPVTAPQHSAAGCGGCKGPALGSRAGLLDAAVGSDAAVGPGELGTAACRERLPLAAWESPTQQTLLWGWGNPGVTSGGLPASGESIILSRDAGLGLGSPGDGWRGGNGEGHSSALGGWQGPAQPCPAHARSWQSMGMLSRPWASDPRGKQPQQGNCVGAGGTRAGLSHPFASG